MSHGGRGRHSQSAAFTPSAGRILSLRDLLFSKGEILIHVNNTAEKNPVCCMSTIACIINCHNKHIRKNTDNLKDVERNYFITA